MGLQLLWAIAFLKTLEKNITIVPLYKTIVRPHLLRAGLDAIYHKVCHQYA